MLNKIEHIGIAVKNIQEGIRLFNLLLNQEPYKEEEVPSEDVKTVFYRTGESKIELLASGNENSAISKFIEKKGEGVHHMIRIYNTKGFSLLHTLESHENSVFALSYSPNGKFLLSGGRDVMLKCWDTDGYALLKSIPAHTLHINAIAFNPAGTLFATGSMDKTLKIWNAETFELIKVIDKARNEGHAFSINKILWIDNERLLTCADDKTAMLWNIRLID